MQFNSKFSIKNEDFLKSIMKWSPRYVPAPSTSRDAKVDEIARNFVDTKGLGAGDGYVSPAKKRRVEDSYYNPAEGMPIDGNIMHEDAVTLAGTEGGLGLTSPIVIAGIIILLLCLKG